MTEKQVKRGEEEYRPDRTANVSRLLYLISLTAVFSGIEIVLKFLKSASILLDKMRKQRWREE